MNGKKIFGIEKCGCSDKEIDDLNKFIDLIESGARENSVEFVLVKESELSEDEPESDKNLSDEVKVWIDLVGDRDPIPDLLKPYLDRVMLRIEWWGGVEEEYLSELKIATKNVIEIAIAHEFLVVVCIGDSGPIMIHDINKMEVDKIDYSFQRFGEERHPIYHYFESGWSSFDAESFVKDIMERNDCI